MHIRMKKATKEVAVRLCRYLDNLERLFRILIRRGGNAVRATRWCWRWWWCIRLTFGFRRVAPSAISSFTTGCGFGRVAVEYSIADSADVARQLKKFHKIVEEQTNVLSTQRFQTVNYVGVHPTSCFIWQTSDCLKSMKKFVFLSWYYGIFCCWLEIKITSGHCENNIIKRFRYILSYF